MLTQDRVPASGAVCPSGFFGGAGLQIWLQNDPIAPGQSLTLYACATSVVSNTVPAYGTATQEPPGSLVNALSCTGNENWYTPTWTGTLTYNYRKGSVLTERVWRNKYYGVTEGLSVPHYCSARMIDAGSAIAWRIVRCPTAGRSRAKAPFPRQVFVQDMSSGCVRRKMKLACPKAQLNEKPW